MFSGFGKIFTSGPRQTEHADTRMAIRRQEPDQERRKNKKHNQDENEIFGEDNMSVSIEALRIFLENFIAASAVQPETAQTASAETSEAQTKAQTKPPAESENESQNPKAQTPEPPPPTHKADGIAARAAGAYQTMARRHSETTAAPLTAQGIMDHHQLDIGTQDVRIIHALIKDLKNLEKQGVPTLNIERADSFLNSLVNAVDRIKHPERYH